MRLYHYTAGEYLRGIAKHGLTVGDVMLDATSTAGLIGVWFTTSPSPNGHGVDTSALDKQRFRLTVEVPADDERLVKWVDWAPDHVTPQAIAILKSSAAKASGVDVADTWHVYFGWIKPEWIIDAVDIESGETVPNWQACWPEAESLRGVPYWRRQAWQKQMLKKGIKYMRAAHGVVPGVSHQPLWGH